MNIRTLCLGILSFKEASGYEIKKMVEDGMFSHFIDASYGSIYPALTQMLAEGMVTVRAEEQSGRPDKKVYAITPKGQLALGCAIDVLPRPDKFKSEFLFQVLLMDNLEHDRLAEFYDVRLGELKAELARIRECCTAASLHPGHKFVNGYGQAVIGAAVTYLETMRDEMLAPGSGAHTEAAE